jgi:hypothetical protein
MIGIQAGKPVRGHCLAFCILCGGPLGGNADKLMPIENKQARTAMEAIWEQ